MTLWKGLSSTKIKQQQTWALLIQNPTWRKLDIVTPEHRWTLRSSLEGFGRPGVNISPIPTPCFPRLATPPFRLPMLPHTPSRPSCPPTCSSCEKTSDAKTSSSCTSSSSFKPGADAGLLKTVADLDQLRSRYVYIYIYIYVYTLYVHCDHFPLG